VAGEEVLALDETPAQAESKAKLATSNARQIGRSFELRRMV